MFSSVDEDSGTAVSEKLPADSPPQAVSITAQVSTMARRSDFFTAFTSFFDDLFIICTL